MSVELEGFLQSEDEANRDLEKVYTEERLKAIRGLFQDIEISRPKFLLLVFVLNSLACITAMSLDLGIFRLQTESELTFNYLGFILGVIGGTIYSAIRLDRSGKRLFIVQFLLIIGAFNIIIQINLLGFIGIFNFFSFFVTGFVIIALFLAIMTLFLEYTSILERGRVLSYLLIETITVLVFLSVISHLAMLFLPILMYTPLLVIGFTVYYLHRSKKYEIKPLKSSKKEENWHLSKILGKYLAFAFFFSFTLTLAAPSSKLNDVVTQVIQSQEVNLEFLVIIGLLIIISTVGAVTMGYLFDSRGRLISISSIFLLIAIVTLLPLLDLSPLFNALVIFGLYIVILMCIVLLIGDITKRKNFGKVLTLGIMLLLLGIITSSFIKSNLSAWMDQDLNSDVVLLGIQYISSVICLIILVNSKETLPYKEKEWFNSLIHLYVIHKDGILLFDYKFDKEERMESDLVSGGIIGLTSLLEEIVGQEKLRIIDHGDKKLMFKYSPGNEAIFVLLIKEDLIVIRNKLDNFIRDFVKKFGDKLKNFESYHVRDWKYVPILIEKHFEKKYFTFMIQKREMNRKKEIRI